MHLARRSSVFLDTGCTLAILLMLWFATLVSAAETMPQRYLRVAFQSTGWTLKRPCGQANILETDVVESNESYSTLSDDYKRMIYGKYAPKSRWETHPHVIRIKKHAIVFSYLVDKGSCTAKVIEIARGDSEAEAEQQMQSVINSKNHKRYGAAKLIVWPQPEDYTKAVATVRKASPVTASSTSTATSTSTQAETKTSAPETKSSDPAADAAAKLKAEAKKAVEWQKKKDADELAEQKRLEEQARRAIAEDLAKAKK